MVETWTCNPLSIKCRYSKDEIRRLVRDPLVRLTSLPLDAFVAKLDMRGQGTFFDPRLDNTEQFPIAAAMKFGHVRNEPDLVTAKLPALHFYQLAIPAPKPPEGSFDKEAAERGDKLFSGKARTAPAATWSRFGGASEIVYPGW
jgi:hypothetical protein